jgi:tetratricopeptide (TPR) repeat protein
MAPEQAAGHHRDITTAVDVYALGAILYELLVHRPPFTGDTPLAILDKVRCELPTRPRSVRDGIPLDLETVCLKCLDKDPGRRYRTVEALAADLNRVLIGEPVLARRAGRFETVRRAIRRHPAVASLSLVLLLTLIAGLIVTGRQLQHTRRERNRAEHHLAQLLDASEQTAVTTVNDFELRTEAMSPLRHKLLAESAERFAQLASQLGDDPSEQLLRGRCYLQLAVLLFHLGKTDESRAASLRAVESYSSHSRRHPDDVNAAFGHTAALIRLALSEHDDLARHQTTERAEQAYARFLAIPEPVRGPSHEREGWFATFHYDLAVIACSRGDRLTARHYLARSCERLRPLCLRESPNSRQARLLLAHFLRFRCQIERFDGQPGAAMEAGSESLAIAEETVRERSDDHLAWLSLAGAHIEYGLALKKAGKPKQAIGIWREGYERLGHVDAARSTSGLAGATARLGHNRLMIAHNLALEYGTPYITLESERWFQTGVELARPLLIVMPNDRQLWYIHGMCCANLVRFGRRYRDHSRDRMTLQDEELASLEIALRMKPDDNELRGHLGRSWYLYAIDLSKANKDFHALFALGKAIAHQAGSAATSNGQSVHNRLRSHGVKFVEVVMRFLITWRHSFGASSASLGPSQAAIR